MKNISSLHHISQETKEFSHVDSIERALKGGAKWTQLRIKNKPESEVKELAKQAKTLCAQYHATLVINDYLEICNELDLDGVHLGLTDTSTAVAREVLGPNKIIGGSCNTLEDIIYHYKNGVDYVGIGPFTFTSTKEKLSPVLGLKGYKNILTELHSKNIQIPVIGIGGITLKDVSAIKETGIHGVAVASLINLNKSPEKITREILTRLELNF